jgi:RimJ/RimL family protein N-acetyltransferase
VPTLLPLFRDAIATDSPSHPEPAEPYFRMLAGQRASRRKFFLLAHHGDRATGYLQFNRDNTVNRDMAYGSMWIAAEDRAEVAGPLLDAGKAAARNLGCARLVLDTSEFSGYDPVYAAGGGRVLADERRRQLDLNAIDREEYAAWAAPSGKNAHYRTEIWRTPTPEHLLAPLVTAIEAMRDAPHGELTIEHPPPDVDRRRRAESDNLAAGATMYVCAAFAEDGQIAGFHEVLVFPGFRMADIGNTGVPAAFRGHGLGLRLKAAMTLHVLEQEPHIDLISTWNDADNGPMIRVNELMGFEVAETWHAWQFDL